MTDKPSVADYRACSRFFNMLTNREFEVCRLVSEGLSNLAIAERMYVSGATVEAYLTRVYHKMSTVFSLDGYNARCCLVLVHGTWRNGLAQ